MHDAKKRDAYIRSVARRIFYGLPCSGIDTEDLRSAFHLLWPNESFLEWTVRERIRSSLRLLAIAEAAIEQADGDAEAMADKVMKGIK